MKHSRKVLLAVAVLLVAGAVVAVPVTAQETNSSDAGTGTPVEEEDDDGGDTIVNINLDEVVDAITEFTDSWDSTLKDVIVAVLFKPFRTLAQLLLENLVLVLTNTPSIYPNPAVEQVHGQVLTVTYLLSSIVLMAAGVLYMTGPLFGVSYQQVRMILPRVLIALVFGSVSLSLLQYGVELSDALVVAFAPSQLSMTVGQLAGVSTALVLVWLINAVQLLALVVLFIMRGVYLLFVAAISPLLALLWAFPKTKRYADTFIAGWFTALAMAPLDVLVLKFVMAMLEMPVGSGLQGLSNWMYGIAGFTLLLWVPYQLYGASQAAVGQAYSVAGGVKTRYRRYQKRKRHEELLESKKQNQQLNRRMNDRRRRQRTDGGNEYSSEIDEMHRDEFDDEIESPDMDDRRSDENRGEEK